MDGYHKSVLLQEVVEYLQVKKDCWYLDCTLGDGGYCLEILKNGGRIIGIDADPEAIKRTKGRFSEEGVTEDKYIFNQGNFSKLDEYISDKKISGVVFDLGVSTLQLKDPKRGFSFLYSGPIDMRMSPDLSIKAVDLINALNSGELEILFKNYGEENYSRKIAEAIVKRRPFESTTELADVIERAVGGRYSKIHPATKVFQALRIAVNDELEVLKEALPKALKKLESGGRIVVVSFHSLEDGIVKDIFKEWEVDKLGMILTDKPLEPSEDEVFGNISSRSAKLRAFEKS